LRRRWEKAASALGIAPPSPTPGTVDSKEDQTNREPGGTSTPKKSMLGLYTSPSKKSPVTPSDANGSARSFKRAAQKIASARRVGERWDILPTIVGRMGRANGTDSGGGGNLLDELMTLPDFVEQAKTDSLANETALTRLQKNAVTDAVRLLRIELGPGFNATKEREIGSAFETALFEHTAAYELGWETKELAWATEVLGLRDENEKLVTEKAAAQTALTASTGESKQTIFELNAELASARDVHSELETMHMKHVEQAKELIATKRETGEEKRLADELKKEEKSAALSALTASTDESNRTIFELNAELASARDLHSEFEVMHMQHVEETKEVLATVKREAAEAKSAALSALTASTDESNRTIFELNAELASVTQKLKSKQLLIDTALERACVAEASVLERGVELKNAIAAAEAAKTETHEKSALVEKLNLQNKGVGEKLVTKTDELSRLRLELALALRDASQKVHPSLLDELEMKVGRVMLAKDEAEQRTRFAESRFEKLQTEMDERWSDALVTAEAEKQVH
jgi:hypothetical protein